MEFFIVALFFFGLAVILFRGQAKEQKEALQSIAKRKSNPFADFIGRGNQTIISGDDSLNPNRVFIGPKGGRYKLVQRPDGSFRRDYF